MGVILLSLLAASFVLPPLARGLEGLPPAGHSAESAARVAAARAALDRLREFTAEPGPDVAARGAREAAAARLVDRYQRRIDSGGDGEDAQEAGREADAARQLRLRALVAERDELYRLRRAGELDDDVHRRLVRELDLLETSLLSSG
jgi:CPA1 family monovalent cation:H+ antiporter